MDEKDRKADWQGAWSIFAKSIDARIVAEGIETETELKVLKTLGVELEFPRFDGKRPALLL